MGWLSLLATLALMCYRVEFARQILERLFASLRHFSPVVGTQTWKIPVLNRGLSDGPPMARRLPLFQDLLNR